MIEREVIVRWREEDEEAREIRRKNADWKFIEEQPEPLRSALKCFVELGDLRLAAKIAEMGVDEFNQLRIKARIPIVL
ncbi:MAG: hypothetical protein ACP5KE_03210 [Candidatus Methanodesulfokora sp.]